MQTRVENRSNVDFVNFIWNNFGFLQGNLLLLFVRRPTCALQPTYPSLYPTTPLYSILNIRATSDRLWKDRKNSGECIVKNRLSLKIISGCPDWTWLLYLQAKASLRDMFGHIFPKHTFWIDYILDLQSPRVGSQFRSCALQSTPSSGI